MKNTHKLAIFGALILCVFFVGQKYANAGAFYSQSFANGYHTATSSSESEFVNDTGVRTIMGSGAAYYSQFFGTDVGNWPYTGGIDNAIPTTTNISTLNSLTISLQADNNNADYIGMYVNCKNSSGMNIEKHSVYSWDARVNQLSAGTWTTVKFIFDTSDTCDMRYPISRFGLNIYMTFGNPNSGYHANIFRIKASSGGFRGAFEGMGLGNGYSNQAGQLGFAWYFEINSTGNAGFGGGLPNEDYSSCPATDFKINFGVGEVDFGKGVCNIVNYLIIPSQESVNSWDSSLTDLQTHAPFTYFYQVKDAISNLATTTTSTIPSLTITTPSSSPIQINIIMFSSSTLTAFTSSTGRNKIRVAMEATLYIAFAFMVFWEGRRLFKKI